MSPELPKLLALDDLTFVEVHRVLRSSLEKWSTEPKLTTALLKALAAKKGPQLASLVLQTMAFSSLEVNGFHCSAVISSFASYQWPESLKVLEDYCLDSISVNAALKACDKAGKWQVACHLLTLVDVNVIGYNTCISVCGKTSQWSTAQELWQHMREYKIQPDQMSYNSLMWAYSRGSEWSKATSLLQDLTSSQLKADDFGYLAVLTAISTNALWQQALALLKEMPKPSLEALNACITACERGNAWPWALGLLSTMRDVTLQPDLVSFNATISACGRTWPLAIHLMEVVHQVSLGLDAVAFSSAIHGAGWQETLQLLGWMHFKRLPPNAVCFGAAINSAAADRWRESIALLLEMAVKRLAANVICYNAAITACVMSEWDKALAFWTHMTYVGRCTPTLSTYSAVIRSCSEGGRWQEALEFFQQLRQQQLRPNLVALSALCTACEKSAQWQLAVHFLEEIVMADFSCDVIAFNATISACEKASEWIMALAVLQQLVESQLEPNQTTFNALVSACDRAVRLGVWADEMRRAGRMWRTLWLPVSQGAQKWETTNMWCGQTMSCMGPQPTCDCYMLLGWAWHFSSLPATTGLCIVCLLLVSSSCHRCSPRQCRDQPR